MVYHLYEISAHDSEPVELYTFTRGANVFRYTSADEDHERGGFTYTATPLSRGSIKQDLEAAKQPLELEGVKDLEVVQTYRSSPSANVTTVKIQRLHEGDDGIVTLWLGRIVNVKFGERTCKIRCEPFFTSLKRSVLRMRYQTNCPHALYSTACTMLPSTWVVEATLSGANGTQLISGEFAGYDDGYFTGGYVVWDNAGVLERRAILDHVGTDLTIDLPFEGMPGNADVDAYPGCDHTLATCRDKFSNLDNYGGQPFYPGKNPMNGTPIF